MIAFDVLPRDRSMMMERLDLESAYFEQHYSQVTDAFPFDADASASVGLLFRRILPTTARQTLNELRISTADGNTSAPAIKTGCWCLSINHELPINHEKSDGGSLHVDEHAVDIRLLQSVDADLAAILEWLDQIDPSNAPVLIVTAKTSRGPSISDTGNAEPGEPQLSEHHVPLWIRLPDFRMRRIQAVSGSLDLIPTIHELLADPFSNISARYEGGGTDFLMGLPDCAAGHDLKTSPIPRIEHQNTTDALSLVPLCFHPGIAVDRVLRILFAGYEMLRTTNFLLVREQVSGAGGQAGNDFRETRPPRLYVKPEDIWQIHDQAGVYQSVIEEMDAIW